MLELIFKIEGDMEMSRTFPWYEDHQNRLRLTLSTRLSTWRKRKRERGFRVSLAASYIAHGGFTPVAELATQ